MDAMLGLLLLRSYNNNPWSSNPWDMFGGMSSGGGSMLQELLLLDLFTRSRDADEEGGGLLDRLLKGNDQRSGQATSLRSNQVDLSGDGKYKAGVDGEVFFDFTGDGRILEEDVKTSKEVLSAYDDPTSSEGAALRDRLKAFDKNNDGLLNAEELRQAGLTVRVDRDKDPETSRGEYSPGHCIETNHGKMKITEFDLATGQFKVEKYLPPVE